MLTALGAKTDCVIVHYYLGGASAAGMLKDSADIAGIVSTLHNRQYAKVDPAGVKVVVTEANSTIVDTKAWSRRTLLAIAGATATRVMAPR